MKFPDLFKSQFTQLARETASSEPEAVKVFWREVIDSPKQILPSKVFEKFIIKNKVLGDILWVLQKHKAKADTRYC